MRPARQQANRCNNLKTQTARPENLCRFKPTLGENETRLGPLAAWRLNRLEKGAVGVASPELWGRAFRLPLSAVGRGASNRPSMTLSG